MTLAPRMHEKKAVPFEMDEQSSCSDTALTIDEVLENMETGLYQYYMLVICGLAYMSDALEISLLVFLSLSVAEEWDLTSVQKATITSVVFAGQWCGALLIWRSFADNYGRKLTVTLGTFMIAFGGVCSALSPSLNWLLLFRFMAGIGVGSGYVAFDLLSEFLPSAHRGAFLINMNYFWTAGSVMVSIFAWAILDQAGWRVLAVVCAIPVSISCVLSIFYLPESPRWLLLKGKRKELIANVIHAYKTNGKTPPTDLQHVSMGAEEEEEGGDFWSYFTSIKALFSSGYRRTTLLLLSIYGIYGFSYYGLILFIGRINYNDEANIEGDDASSFHYDNILINAASELVGIFVTSQIIDRWGRRPSQFGFYLLNAIAVLLVVTPLMPPPMITFFAGCARLFVFGAVAATYVITPELYPTALRVSGHAVAASVSRLAGMSSPYYVLNDGISNAGVGLTLSALNACAALCAWLLPETSGADMESAGKDGSSKEHKSLVRYTEVRSDAI